MGKGGHRKRGPWQKRDMGKGDMGKRRHGERGTWERGEMGKGGHRKSVKGVHGHILWTLFLV